MNGTDGPEGRSSSPSFQQLGEDEINWLPEAHDPHRANTQNSHAYKTKRVSQSETDERDKKGREEYFSKSRYRILVGREHLLLKNELPRRAEDLLLSEN